MSILMYHSISGGEGPTCISPQLFRKQLEIVREYEYEVVPLLELLGRLRRNINGSVRTIAITFDDAYADFATTALPELRNREWPATVFLPVSKIGSTDSWSKSHSGARLMPLMDWDTLSQIACQGIELGSHAMSHTDLTRLPFHAACEEIGSSKRRIEGTTGCTVCSFSPPYGATNRKLQDEIKKCYSLAVSTRMSQVSYNSYPYALPRIDMFYFKNLSHWRAFLEHGPSAYFRFRKALRTARSIATAWR